MKETAKVTSILCGVVAVMSLFMGFRAITGRGYFMQLALFSMARQGTGMGFVGNIVNMVFTAIGFGSMAVLGLVRGNNTSRSKKAFIWGIIMTSMCLLSLIFSILARTFNLGDVILLVLPAIYTYAVLKTA